MVATERISANTLFPFDLNPRNIPQEPSIGIPMDMEVDTPRDRSSSSKTDSSRETSVLSNASSTAYVDRVQALTNNPTWAEQVEQGEIEEPVLSYVTLKERETDSANQANASEPTPNPHGTVINDTCPPQGLETSAIPYSINQPADLQLWDRSLELTNTWKVMLRTLSVHFTEWQLLLSNENWKTRLLRTFLKSVNLVLWHGIFSQPSMNLAGAN